MVFLLSVSLNQLQGAWPAILAPKFLVEVVVTWGIENGVLTPSMQAVLDETEGKEAYCQTAGVYYTSASRWRASWTNWAKTGTSTDIEEELNVTMGHEMDPASASGYTKPIFYS